MGYKHKKAVYFDKPLLCKPTTAAKLLGTSLRQVYILIGDGKLIAHNDEPGKKGLAVLWKSIENYKPSLRIAVSCPPGVIPSNLGLARLAYSPSRLARMMDTSRQNIYRMIRSGKLIAYQLKKGSTRVTGSSIENFVTRHILPPMYWLDKDL